MHNSFKSTIFIFDDKVLYISGKNESHAMLIQSKDHFNMISSFFDFLWKNGHRVK